jgi:N-acetyl-anhydromuramyl-L-alanine amidase AmpD
MANATWLADVLRDAGLRVEETDGWKTRGRPGTFGPLKGVMCHHTGSNAKGGNAPDVGIVTNGRPDLAGPLAQLLLARDCTFHVIAAGRCNHAGAGKWQGLTNGNAQFIGIEAENDGVHEEWSGALVETYVRGVAALLKHIGADAVMAVGHKEFALPKGRKTDPDFDMVAFREHVENVMAMGVTQLAAAPVAKADPARAMLRKGDSGNSVRQLQTKLEAGGFYKGKLDGDFGPATDTAVRALQKAKGLTVDGKVGPKTWAALGVA